MASKSIDLFTTGGKFVLSTQHHKVTIDKLEDLAKYGIDLDLVENELMYKPTHIYTPASIPVSEIRSDQHNIINQVSGESGLTTRYTFQSDESYELTYEDKRQLSNLMRTFLLDWIEIPIPITVNFHNSYLDPLLKSVGEHYVSAAYVPATSNTQVIWSLDDKE